MQGSHLRTSVLTVPSIWNTLNQKENSTFKATLKIHFLVNLPLTTRFEILVISPAQADLFLVPCFIFLHRTCHSQTYYKINFTIVHISSLEWKLHEGRDFHLFSSMLYSWYLEWYQPHGGCQGCSIELGSLYTARPQRTSFTWSRGGTVVQPYPGTKCLLTTCFVIYNIAAFTHGIRYP